MPPDPPRGRASRAMHASCMSYTLRYWPPDQYKFASYGPEREEVCLVTSGGTTTLPLLLNIALCTGKHWQLNMDLTSFQARYTVMCDKEKLKAIIEFSKEEHEYNQLVANHKVRWLSLNDYVQRFTDLISEIVLYFEQEAQNTAVRPSERTKLQEFHDELVQLFSCTCTLSKVAFHC